MGKLKGRIRLNGNKYSRNQKMLQKKTWENMKYRQIDTLLLKLACIK